MPNYPWLHPQNMAAGWELNALPAQTIAQDDEQAMREVKLSEWMETVSYFEDTPGRPVERSPGAAKTATWSCRHVAIPSPRPCASQ